MAQCRGPLLEYAVERPHERRKDGQGFQVRLDELVDQLLKFAGSDLECPKIFAYYSETHIRYREYVYKSL